MFSKTRKYLIVVPAGEGLEFPLAFAKSDAEAKVGATPLVAKVCVVWPLMLYRKPFADAPWQ